MKNRNRKLSRRDALKLFGTGATGAVLASCGVQSSPTASATATTGVVAAATNTPGTAATVAKKAIKATLWTHVAKDEQNWFASEWATSASKNAPDYDAQLEIVSMAHGDLHNKVLANMSAGQELPDVMGLTHDFWGRFETGTIIEDNLAPLNDLIADVQSNAIGEGAWSKSGKFYGMREDIASTAYWYRDDLVKASGLTAPFATWDDVMAAGKALKSPTKYMREVVIDGFAFNMLEISQLAGMNWTEDGKWNLNTPEALEVITYLKKGVDEKVFLPVSQNDFWGSKFIAGDETIGTIMPSWYGTFVLFPALPDQSGKWRVQNMPTWGSRGHKSTSVWGGTAWTFSKKSPNLDVILKIAKGMYFDTDARIRYASFAKSLPAWTPALNDDRLKNLTEPFLGGQTLNQVFAEGLTDSVQYIGSVNDSAIGPLLDEGWTNLMAGKQTPQEFLDSMDKQVKDLGIPLAKG
jgi:ABC-type glycerol-3-phosphate transport system substrate-binding protein